MSILPFSKSLFWLRCCEPQCSHLISASNRCIGMQHAFVENNKFHTKLNFLLCAYRLFFLAIVLARHCIEYKVMHFSLFYYPLFFAWEIHFYLTLGSEWWKLPVFWKEGSIWKINSFLIIANFPCKKHIAKVINLFYLNSKKRPETEN